MSVFLYDHYIHRFALRAFDFIRSSGASEENKKSIFDGENEYNAERFHSKSGTDE